MYAMIVFLFVQNALDVQLVNTLNYGVSTKAECEARAIVETKTLPHPYNDARWQYATCVQVQS